MSTSKPLRKWTTSRVQTLKGKRRLTALTAADYATAKLIDQAGVHVILVGDSLGMTVLGYESTLPVTLEGMIHHTAAVSRGVQQAMVVGDGKNYLAALVTLDQLAVEEYAQKNGIAFSSFEELATKPEIIQLIDREVAEKNKQLPSFETIKKLSIVPEFTVENGLLTPTLKWKKNLVREKYKENIESLYS